MAEKSAMKRARMWDIASVATDQVVDVEVTTAVGAVMSTLQTLSVQSMPVYVLNAAPGTWRDVGHVVGHKRYVGIVSVLDLVAFLFRASGFYSAPGRLYELDDRRLALALEAPVAQALGSTVESLKLCVEPAEVDWLWALEEFSVGVHRALVDVGPDRAVRLVTQTNLLRFILDKAAELDDPAAVALRRFLEETALRDLETARGGLVTVFDDSDLVPALHSMLQQAVHAAAVVDHATGQIISTLSVTDLNGVAETTLPWLGTVSVRDFLRDRHAGDLPLPVFCDPAESLATATKFMLDCEVHRVWIVDSDTCGDIPISVFTMSDVIRGVYQHEMRRLDRQDL